MLQDISCGRLENEFRNVEPTADAIVVCFQDGKVLIKRTEDGNLYLPTYSDVTHWAWENDWAHWNELNAQYVFRMDNKDYFIWMGKSGEPMDAAYTYENVKTLRNDFNLDSKIACFGVMTAWHLYAWYRDNRYCGRCGTPAVHDEKERMMRCPNCGNMMFPKIAPAVIVAVTNGDKILMSKYAGRGTSRYALLAGFCEIGETAEQTVQREVMEEVGLHVKNIRYYKTQCWGVEQDLLLGFFCDVDGDDTITMDREELALADWYDRDAMPAKDDGVSLTREMMRVFSEGREPK